MAFRLHSRLVLLNGIAIGIATLLLSYSLSSSIKTGLEADIEDQLLRSARLGAEYIKVLPNRDDPQQLSMDLARHLGVRTTMIAPDGKVRGDSDLTAEGVGRMENHANRPEVIQALQTGRGTAIRLSDTVGVPFIYVAVRSDEGVLRLAMPLSTVEALISGLRRQLAAALFFCIVLTLVFGYMVYAVISRPLRSLAESSRELAIGNLDHEIPEGGDRDLELVAASLNRMARSLRVKMQEMHEEKRQVDAIVQAMSPGVAVFDRSARAVLANQSIRQLLDIQGDPLGRTPMELVRHPAVAHAIREALEGMDMPAVDLATGGGRMLSAKATPVRQSTGQVDLAVVVFHDLTELRRIEKMRKDFVANVSHEFKTPLTSIRGYAETLANNLPEDQAVRLEFLRAIERNSELLQVMVEDLLVLSQLENEPKAHKTSINICALIEEQVKTRSRALTEKRITVEIDCAAAEASADRDRLERALSNLVDNAIYYNRPDGRIRIATRATTNQIIIDVADTGLGIRQEDLPRVFERFYRVEKSRNRESGGTGLGLAIARHAVESQGGSISVTSQVGVGSTFSITLPL